MNEARLAQLIERYFDHELSPDEKVEMEAALLTSAQARQQFWGVTEWYALFRQWGEEEAERKAVLDEIRVTSAQSPENHNEPSVGSPQRHHSRTVRPWLKIHPTATGIGIVVTALAVVGGILCLMRMALPQPPRTQHSIAATPSHSPDADTPSDTHIASSLPRELPKPEATPVPPIPSAIADLRPPATPVPMLKPVPVPVPPAAPKPPPLMARAIPAPATPNPQTALAVTPRPDMSQKATPPTGNATSETSELFASSSFWQATTDAGNSPDRQASVEFTVRGKRLGRAPVGAAQPLLAAGKKPLPIAPRESFNLRFPGISSKVDPILGVVDFKVSDRLFVVGFTQNRQFADVIQFGDGITMGGQFELVTLMPNRDGDLFYISGTTKPVRIKELDQIYVREGRLFRKGATDKDDAGVEVQFAPGAGRTGIAVTCSIPPDGR